MGDFESNFMESANDANSLYFENPILIANQSLMNINHPDFNIENFQIDTNDGNNLLKINLGSDELPRNHCANHKLDLAAKKAVEKHPELLEICSKPMPLKSMGKTSTHF